MEEQLRLCYYTGTPGVLDLDQKYLSGYGKGPRFHGPLGEAFNLLIEGFFGNDKFNYSSVLGKSTEDFNVTSGLFERGGCLHSMQMNQSDFSLIFSIDPQMGKHLKQFPPYLSDNSFLFTRYNVTGQINAMDFTSSFVHIFPFKVWILCFFFVLIFWSFVKLHHRLDNKSLPRRARTRDDSLYRMLTHLFHLNFLFCNDLSMREISFLMTFFSLNLLTYLKMSMKTEIVVVEEPRMINTYDDLLDSPRLKLLFMQEEGHARHFEQAREGSKERKLWQKSLDEVGGDRKQMFFELTGTDTSKMVLMAEVEEHDVTLERVLIVSKMTKAAARYGSCLLKVMVLNKASRRKVANFYSWLSKDPDAQEYILSLAHSIRYKSPVLSKIIKRFTWGSNLGLGQMYLFKLDKLPFDIIKIENQAQGDTYRDCLADNFRINLPQVSHEAFSLVQFKILLFVCQVIICTTVISLLFEFKNKQRAQIVKMKRRMACLMALYKDQRLHVVQTECP